MDQEGGLFSGRNLLIIAVAAVAAYFLFFRNKSSNAGGATGASGDTTTMGDTTVQSGAVTITVTDNTTQAGNSKPGPGPGLPDKEPADQDDPNNPASSGNPANRNPQPGPPMKPPTSVSAAPGGTGNGGAGAVGPRNAPAPRPAARPPVVSGTPGNRYLRQQANARARPNARNSPSRAAVQGRGVVPAGYGRRAAPKPKPRTPPRRQPGTLGFGR